MIRWQEAWNSGDSRTSEPRTEIGRKSGKENVIRLHHLQIFLMGHPAFLHIKLHPLMQAVLLFSSIRVIRSIR